MSVGPERLDDTRAMWRVSVAMYLVGAVTILAVLQAPDPIPTDRTPLYFIALGHALAGGALWLLGPRRRAIVASPFVGILAVSAIVALSRPVSAAPFFYLWPVVVAAYYFTPRLLGTALALMTVAFGIALLLGDEPEVRTMLFVGGMMSTTLVAIVINRLRRQLDRVVQAFERSAATDPLTGVLNRRGFAAEFERELARAARAGTDLTLVVLDLDHFKQVNDRFGHAVGDEVLLALADVVRAQSRAGEPIARTGGEEFAVLLVADRASALRYLERVATAEGLRRSPAGPVAFSAGVAQLGPGVPTAEELLLAADRELYRAKRAGRGRACVHGAGPEPVRLGTAPSVPHVA